VLRVTGQIVIPAPASEVFALLCDPYRMIKLNPGWVIDKVTDLPGGLHRTRLHTRRPDGVLEYRETEDLERVSDTRTVVRDRLKRPRGGDGKLVTTFIMLNTYTLTRVAEGTLVTSTVEDRFLPWYRDWFMPRSLRDETVSSLNRGNNRVLEQLRDAIVSAPDHQPVSPTGTDSPSG